MKNSSIVPSFEGKEIRKVWYDEQWYFSVIDIIEVLTDSSNPSVYWSALKKRETESFTFCKRFSLARANGKTYPTDCANTEGVFRIVMSVPSPKAEPLKMWLAEQGSRTIDETENPELLSERQAEIYRAKGYSDEWILRRMQTIDTRKQLTDEWKNRGVVDNREFSILTATIAKGTFGLNPTEHKKLKGLEKPSQNLRDHMTPLELILTALGEETTRVIAVNQNAQGYEDNHEAATKGGKTAGEARERVEIATGEKVVSDKNYLHLKSEKIDKLPESTEPKE